MREINTSKCISTWGTRDKGRGDFFNNCPARHDETVVEALNGLLQFELGFGGHVEDIKEDGDLITITVVTKVMGCKDTVYYQGTKEDMRPLLEAIHFWAMACEHDNGTIDRAVQTMCNEKGTMSPFIAVNFGPLLIGQGRVRVAMLLACGLTEETDIERAAKVKTSDLSAAIGLWLECSDGVPFAPFLDQIAA